MVMGTIMANGIYNGANPAFKVQELLHQLKDSEPRFILAARNCLNCALEGADLAGLSRERVFLYDEFPLLSEDDFQLAKSNSNTRGKHQTWINLISSPSSGAEFTWTDLPTPSLSSRTALLIYSSGTTGLPKGVELTHFELISNIRQVSMMQQSTRDSCSTRRRHLCALPMYHGLGLLFYNLFVPAWRNAEVYLMERYDLLPMLSHIQRYKITDLMLVPPIVVAMAKHPALHAGKYDLRSVQRIMAGAAPLGMEATKQFEELWNGRVKIRQGWGMSEAPACSLLWHEDDYCQEGSESSTSVGEPIPGLEAMLVDDNGAEMTEPGQRGELWVRGPNVMKGYWRREQATKDTKTADGWLTTGDIAYFDGSKRFYIVDRKKVCMPYKILEFLVEQLLISDRNL